MRAKDPGRKSAFNIGPANIRRSDAAPSRHAFLKSERVIRVQSEAGPVERPLRIECVIKLGTKHLDVPLRLREAAHNAMYTVQKPPDLPVRQGMIVRSGVVQDRHWWGGENQQ